MTETANAPAIPLDKSATEIRTNANALIAKAGELKALGKIETKEQLEAAVSLRSLLSDFFKKAEETRLNLVRPFNDAVKNFNAYFKDEITGPLDQAKKDISPMIEDKLRRDEAEAEARRKAAEEEERKRREAEEQKRLEEAERLQAEGKTDEAEKVLEEATHIAEAPSSIPATVSRGPARGSIGGSASLRKTWDAKLDAKLDEEKAFEMLPARYKLPVNQRIDWQAVRKDIAGDKGLREIPGLEIFQKSSLTGR